MFITLQYLCVQQNLREKKKVHLSTFFIFCTLTVYKRYLNEIRQNPHGSIGKCAEAWSQKIYSMVIYI